MRWLYAPFLSLIAVSANAELPKYGGNAPVAYLVDLQSGAVLHDRDSMRKIPTASMAKMMTAEVAFEAFERNKLKPKTVFTVSPKAWAQWNNQGSTMFLRSGERVSAQNLLYGILTLSGNDASVVLAEGMHGSEAKFTNAMNVAAKRLHMPNSHFATANGWPDGGKTFSTARDLSVLARHIIEAHPASFRAYFSRESFRWGNVTQANRNPLLGAVAGADGMKTGHSDEAGYCLVGTVERGGRRLILVVAGLPSMEARLQEARALAQWGFDAWANKPLIRRNAFVAKVPVQLAANNYVDVVAPHDLAATLPKGKKMGAFKLSVKYNGPVRAPIKKGDEIAQLVVTLPAGEKQIMPLAAAMDVPKAGFWGRAWSGMKSVVGQ